MTTNAWPCTSGWILLWPEPGDYVYFVGAKALVELGHADENGNYDNGGYRLRGHQLTDAEGRWWFDTIVPGLYLGRTRHLDLKGAAARVDAC